MEVGNAEKVVFLAPVTPLKCTPATAEFNSINNFMSTNSSDKRQKKDEEVSGVIGGRSEFLSGYSKSASVAPSTPMKGNPRKKQCGSLDLNERPLKKPRRRKHTPKIFDESKPKKTPKPSIPKSGNSKASAKTKKKLEKDCDKVSDDRLSGDVDIQTPNSKIPEIIPESLVLQVSTPQPEILEHVIPSTDLGHDSKSCKRSLHFDLENENDVISVGAAEVNRNHVTNLLDSFNEQAVDTNSSIGLEDNLEAESTSQPNQGNDPSIYQDDQRACQHHLLKVYKRRKTKIDLMLLAENEANNNGTIGPTSCQHHLLKVYKRRKTKIDLMLLAENEANNNGTIGPTSCQDHFLKVYKRRTIGNIGAVSLAGNETISHKARDKGGHFLKVYKRRTIGNIGAVSLAGNETISQKARDKGGSQLDFLEICRTQNNIGTADSADKGWNALDTNTKCKVTSSAKTTGRRKGRKRATKKHVKIARRCFTISKTRRNFEIVNGAKNTCFSTINLGQKGKFRSQFVGKVLPNENQISAAMADPESFECVFSLSPMVKSQRRRSIHPKKTKPFLTLSPLVTSKRKRSKNCKRSTAILDSLCLKSEISANNGIESFIDKWSACNEDSWPQTDKSACYDIQRHEDLLPRTNKSKTCHEIQECPKHKNIRRRTKRNLLAGSTNMESLVAELIWGLEKIRICDKRSYKKKTTSNQLVLVNSHGPIITYKKKKKKKREEVPRVDLDAESERVWNLLIENGGIDEEPDEEKNIWWEEQRKIFKGRVGSFIARMRLVLGNRTFSQWKGSVVDSVVGVYLTQNVSDYLSSNAFMLLASAFPLQNKQEEALAITQGLPDSFVKDFESSSSSRNTSENIENESTCTGSQSSVNSCNPDNETGNLPDKISRKKKNKLPKRKIDWDELRKTYSTGRYSGSSESNRDFANWEAVRHADVDDIFEQIKCRGQGNVLAAKIKDFLNRTVDHHGSLDLEWLRDVPTGDAKEYLLNIYGLGPKSVDCIRLLSLRHHSFPVDINVARIVVRLGWVPLLPLPDGIQMHLLENYPLESSIQKYLWPRLCKLDMLTLYELHYLMITFGKVFCTKIKPNCDACPMRAECRHFASAFASTRLRLPGPQQNGEAASKQPDRVDDVRNMCVQLPNLSHSSESFLESSFQTQDCEPIIEMPESPEHRPLELLVQDIEDFPYEAEHEQEIPTIKLNTKAFGENILNFIDKSNKEFKESALSFVDEISNLHRDEEVSKALVLLNPKSASHPARKLKTKTPLRTVHSVYELPDDHSLLSGFEKREPGDDCPYLLSISLTEQVRYKPEIIGKVSNSKELELYDSEICSGSTSYSSNDQIVYGTILIPCRTANRGSFPLNGTYFQVNEVFADHESSIYPIHVPRSSIWNLRQRTLYCGSSVSTIFRGFSTEEIQYGFWKGYICVRGYDRKQRAPRPLAKQFHLKDKTKYDELL